MHTFSKPDFEPMFADNITWHNDSLKQEAEEQCGDDHECLFDVASTNDLSVGIVTKDISVQLVNETNALGKRKQIQSNLYLVCPSIYMIHVGEDMFSLVRCQMPVSPISKVLCLSYKTRYFNKVHYYYYYYYYYHFIKNYNYQSIYPQKIIMKKITLVKITQKSVQITPSPTIS